MRIWKKLNFIFTRSQKIKLIILFLLIVIGTFAELVGVTSILPVIQVATESEISQDNILINICIKVFRCTSVPELLFYLALVILVIFVVKNAYIVFMYAMQYEFIYNNQKVLATRLIRAYIKKPYIFHLSKHFL